MEQSLLQKVKEQLLRHEGLRLKPYRCSAGKLTIGRMDGFPIRSGMTMERMDYEQARERSLRLRRNEGKVWIPAFAGMKVL